ncbi:MAG: glycosyltransferase [Oscillospiraceae bacterium]|nr:glycosyltransferase [Oscillospiraceae bacterium]
MKILQINSVCGSGSTGRLVAQTAQLVRENGGQSFVAYGGGTCKEPNSYRINSKFEQKFSIAQTRLLGKHGFYNKAATKKLVKWIQNVNPDIIHLHNLHGHYVNVKILFDYLKKTNKPVVWSLYDCWSFTGHCAHFDFAGCNKWQTGCRNCEQKKNYPQSLIFDRSKSGYKAKKSAFAGVDNMTIVVPSKWLESKVKQSHLNNYKTKLIPSGIDLSAFSPIKSDLREKYNLTDKKIVLAVASQWVKNKGIEYANKLADMLPDEYQVVIIGAKTQEYPNYSKKVLHIHKTENIQELAKWYTAADVLVITTLQETQGLTSVEAFACGTPVVAFNSGGAPEALDEKCGIVVEKCDVEGMMRAIECIVENPQNFTENACIDRSKDYDKNEKLKMYIDLYNEILGR